MTDNYLWYNDIPTNQHFDALICSGTFAISTGHKILQTMYKLGNEQDSINIYNNYFDSEKEFKKLTER